MRHQQSKKTHRTAPESSFVFVFSGETQIAHRVSGEINPLFTLIYCRVHPKQEMNETLFLPHEEKEERREGRSREIGERIQDRRCAPQIHRALHKLETDPETKRDCDQHDRAQLRPPHCDQTRQDRIGDKVINLVRVKGCGGNPN